MEDLGAVVCGLFCWWELDFFKVAGCPFIYNPFIRISYQKFFTYDTSAAYVTNTSAQMTHLQPCLYLQHIYTIILLKSVCLSAFANCRSQFLLDLLGRCLKLSVSAESISCHEFAFQFGLAIFYTRKTSKISGKSGG